MPQLELIAYSRKNKNKSRARFCNYLLTNKLYDFSLNQQTKKSTANFCEASISFFISTYKAKSLTANFCENYIDFNISFLPKKLLDTANFCECVVPTEINYKLTRLLDEAGFCNIIIPN